MSRIVEGIVRIFCITGVIILSFLLYQKWHRLETEQAQFEQLSASVKEIKIANAVWKEDYKEEKREILPEYQELHRENQDFVGWVSIENTVVDYPIMYSWPDTEYYLHRNFYREESYSGTPFTLNESLDQPCLFVYGHNMRNGTMFAELLKYQERAYWECHPVISLGTLYDHADYEVFAVVYAKEDDWEKEDGLMYPFLKMQTDSSRLIQKSIYETGAESDSDGNILFLVTCIYRKDAERLVVAAREINTE